MNCEKSKPCRFAFLGVFILGILGIVVTAKYYLKKEPVADQQARSERIAVEVNRFTQ